MSIKIKASKERKDTLPHKSPLLMLIESIEETLVRFDGIEHAIAIGPNPFHTETFYRFESEADYHYDITLLKSQLRSLQAILASISDR